MMKKLFAIPFTDGRERKHVVAVRATTPEDAVALVIAYQEGYEGFYRREPVAADAVEITPDADEPVQVLWHQDYD